MEVNMNTWMNQFYSRARYFGVALLAAGQLAGWMGSAHAQDASKVTGVSDTTPVSQITIPQKFTPPVISNNGMQGVYTPEAPPSNLAKVVLYRAPNDSQKTGEGLFVYLDGALHTVLRPGGFTSFCVYPSQHTLDTTWGTSEYAPSNGKVLQNYVGGKTYLFQVAAAKGDGSLKPMTEKAAKSDLAVVQKQMHLVSRSTSAVPCQEFAQ
jgi:hypothetical protein